MIIKIQKIILSFLIFTYTAQSQTISKVYKINDLLERISNNDTTYIVNFWATWCKPCIEELPAFDSLYQVIKDKKIKVVLVSLDFIDDLKTKVNPFLKKNKIKSNCVLLDEVNGNNFINKISKNWSGAIPATLFKNQSHLILIENKLNLKELLFKLNKLEKE